MKSVKCILIEYKFFLLAVVIVLALFSSAFSSQFMESQINAPENGLQLETTTSSGMVQTRIPIQVPAGRGKITPKIELVYSSYGKNSWVGLGWDLNLGSITRNTAPLLDYSTDNYVYSTSGVSRELVHRSEWGAGFYGEKIESKFTKYEKKGDSWVATTTDGTKFYFGSTDGSRLYDRPDAARIFKWCLDRVEDTNGNYMTISYTKDQDYQIKDYQDQIYPKEIKYTYHENASPYYTVQFHLEDRDDHFISCDGHFEVNNSSFAQEIWERNRYNHLK